MKTALITWLVAFFTANATPAPRCAHPDACTNDESAERDRYQEVRHIAAEAAVDVAYDPSEAPLFDGPTGRALSALEMAAIATHETGIQPRLWDNVCRTRECDGGAATGELQLHLGKWGVMLRGDRWVHQCTQAEGQSASNVVGPDDCITPSDVGMHHLLGWRIAMHMLRAGGLPLFTGQPDNGPAPTWVRTTMARFTRRHPPPATDDAACR
jgi:hypothetical protein